jgi:hypothetical protein
MEVPGSRARLRDVAGCKGVPQLLLRIGFFCETVHTPRRPVNEVLLAAESAGA